MENDNGVQNDTLVPDGSDNPTGAPGANEGANGSIANQNGSQPSGQTPDVAEENRRLKGQITALQKQIIQSRRSQGTSPSPAPNGQDPNDPAAQVQQQIAIAYQLADGQLREQMESVYDLYPELTSKELSHIRRNPWAYCSRQTFLQGDVETAKLEIEQYIADLVESKGTGQPAPQVPSGKGVSPSPAPQPATVDTGTPGSAEDENPWTMPMDKLEQKAQRIKTSSRR